MLHLEKLLKVLPGRPLVCHSGVGEVLFVRSGAGVGGELCVGTGPAARTQPGVWPRNL